MTAQEILSYAVKCGLTVADIKIFSIGFVLDYIDTYYKLKNNQNIHADEEKYLKLKSVLPFVEEKYNSGNITYQQYSEWMSDYKRLEDIYGINY
ncbi:hypothetical protein [Ruminococcus sp.]|jgi:hypothetical protein|uniref:hypothetical protein n=1 Tax=Ruminococcus sp. TaxID=41978 RepID=UPI00205F81AE|nr:MAG TPA: hypothetical protein [Caudoviricetes sp.]